MYNHHRIYPYLLLIILPLIFALDVQVPIDRPDYCGITPGHYYDTKISDPPNGLQLISLQVLIRHGDRLPYSYCWPSQQQWDCYLDTEERVLTGTKSSSYGRTYLKQYIYGENIFPGSCMVGQLTNYGYRQHITNGAYLRSRYIDKIPFLPDNLELSRISIRSTDVQRTLASAEALIRGIYPNLQDQEVISINTMDLYLDWLEPNPRHCPDYGTWLKNAVESPEFLQYNNNNIDPALKQYSDVVGIPNKHAVTSLLEAFDCLSAHICHEYDLPFNDIESIYHRMVKYTLWSFDYLSSYPNRSTIAKLSSGTLYLKVLNNIIEAYEGNSHEIMHLFSGHDMTILSFMYGLNVWDGKWVPYASMLSIELWSSPDHKNSYVRLIFNGNELIIPDICTSAFCEMNAFLSLLKQLSMDNPQTDCYHSVDV